MRVLFSVKVTMVFKLSCLFIGWVKPVKVNFASAFKADLGLWLLHFLQLFCINKFVNLH